MSARSKGRPGYGRLLDAWVPPEDAGEAVGCLTTTFTFDPAFFEEECLSRFLGIETDPVNDGPLYLIEREEKMAQLACAGVLADSHHCQGSRSLRWDLLPARVPGAVQHAKLTLLVWANRIRLIIASANLTADGYRRNLEVFAVLDYYPGSRTELSCLGAALAFLRKIIAQTLNGGFGSPVMARWEALLTKVEATPNDWGLDEADAAHVPTQVHLVGGGPGAESVFDQLRAIWPAGGPPNRAVVLSPFFDPPEAVNQPAQKLWDVLRKRGKARVEYLLSVEDVPGEPAVFIHAPDTLLAAQPQGRPVDTILRRLELEQIRPLHAKGLWLENDRWALYMVGSSNFTSRGLGLASRSNWEANLAFLVNKKRQADAYRTLRHGLPESKSIPPKIDLRWKPRDEKGEDLPVDDLPLDSAFGWATYRHDQDEERAVVILDFNGTPPDGWRLAFEDDDQRTFYEEKTWRTCGEPEEIELEWTKTRPPSGFWVCWAGSEGKAWWPVNVASAAALPPPEEIKDLPLEVLIDILTSTRPLHRELSRYCRQGNNGGESILIDRDPHKRVDTSSFLLQRTRRFSWALTALKRRLALPVVSQQCLEWRLKGPVGVEAVAKAVRREAQGSPEEQAFLICELALELSNVEPQTAPGCLPAKEVKKAIMAVADQLKSEQDLSLLKGNPELREYVEQVFKVVKA